MPQEVTDATFFSSGQFLMAFSGIGVHMLSWNFMTTLKGGQSKSRAHF